MKKAISNIISSVSAFLGTKLATIITIIVSIVVAILMTTIGISGINVYWLGAIICFINYAVAIGGKKNNNAFWYVKAFCRYALTLVILIALIIMAKPTLIFAICIAPLMSYISLWYLSRFLNDSDAKKSTIKANVLTFFNGDIPTDLLIALLLITLTVSVIGILKHGLLSVATGNLIFLAICIGYLFSIYSKPIKFSSAVFGVICGYCSWRIISGMYPWNIGGWISTSMFLLYFSKLFSNNTKSKNTSRKKTINPLPMNVHARTAFFRTPKLTTTYYLSDTEIRRYTGVISRKTEVVKLKDIKNPQYIRNPILGTGTFQADKIVWTNMPLEFIDELQNTLNSI